MTWHEIDRKRKKEGKDVRKKGKHFIEFYLKECCTHIHVQYTCTLGDINIRKTCPCNEYPLKTHFYIVKLGYAGVYLFFLFLLQNIDCGYSLELPQNAASHLGLFCLHRKKSSKNQIKKNKSLLTPLKMKVDSPN